MQGEEKLKEELERAGWENVRTYPQGMGLRGAESVEAIGEDAGGDISIHVDADGQGAVQGYELYRRHLDPGDAERSGRFPHCGPLPSPEAAVGEWETRQAEEARGLRPVRPFDPPALLSELLERPLRRERGRCGACQRWESQDGQEGTCRDGVPSGFFDTDTPCEAGDGCRSYYVPIVMQWYHRERFGED